MSDTMYDTALSARKAGTGYLTGAYEMGGFDQGAKYQSMQSGILDALASKGPGDFRNPADLGNRLAMRAEAVSNVGAQQVTAGMDELNKIRTLLAGNGLATTNFAQQEGQTRTQAAGMEDFNPTMSTVNAGLGLAASIYGGGKKAGWWSGSQPASSGQTSSFGFGLEGSNLSNWATTPITSLVPPGSFSFTGGPR